MAEPTKNDILYPPCKDCKKRTVGCHVTCADYISYKDNRENNRQKLNNIREGRVFCFAVKSKINRDWRHEKYHGRNK